MGPVRVTFGRTVGRARSLFSTVFAVGGYLSCSALLFAFGLESSEGGRLSLPVIWAGGAAPALPVLAALLAMEVWSGERQSGRMDLLLSAAVRERDYVIGKFLGVLAMLLAVVGAFLVLSLSLLRFLSPGALATVRMDALALAYLTLAVQGMLWSAVAVAFSAVFRHAACAACATVFALVLLPRGLWRGWMSWAASGRERFGELPIDAHVVDFASGIVPLGTLALYFLLAGVALFVATKLVAATRFSGRGSRSMRLSTGLTVTLAVGFALLAAFAFLRVNPVLDIPVDGGKAGLSARTRSILAESSGVLTVTAFQSRKDPSARAVGRLLRAIQRTSASVGGARVELRFVDPRWDVASSERLVRRGVDENSLVFEQGPRMVSLPLAEGVGERLCAATIRRISAPPRRRSVYWTVGHGETRFDDYGAFGMSDIARDLFREGFGHATLDLACDQPIPGDCALVVVAGARDDFSRAEIGRLNAYLRSGGRALVLLRSAKIGGIVSALPSWGLRPQETPLKDVRTLSGTDVIVTEFGDHPIAAPLKGSRIILDRPVSLSPSAVAESGAGVDRIGYSPVAEAGAATVVAAVEQGGGAGDDLALRPMRMVAIGDAGFVVNGQLAVRACANRDFFLNCVAYLSGSEPHGSGEEESDTFATGLDRDGRLRLTVWSALVLPTAVSLLMLAAVAGRRRRR